MQKLSQCLSMKPNFASVQGILIYKLDLRCQPNPEDTYVLIGI